VRVGARPIKVIWLTITAEGRQVLAARSTGAVASVA
jgi:hypothetical protein